MCNTDKNRGVYTATVASNQMLCDEHYKITIELDNFPVTQAGQFVQLQCRQPGEQTSMQVIDWNDDPNTPQAPEFSLPELTENERLLRRPLSLADDRRENGKVQLDIIYRVVGAGTGWLADVKSGQEISVLGPLGTPFPIYENKKYACLIGGGVGIPPMMYLAKALSQAGKNTIAFSGVRTARYLPLTMTSAADSQGTPNSSCKDFADRGAQSVIASDDGSIGYHGLVIEPLIKWLDDQNIDPSEVAVYSCGPERMMQAVGEIAIERGINCDLSLERNMACGMSTCQSCIVKIKNDSDKGWDYKLCCTHGPVFPAESIIWD